MVERNTAIKNESMRIVKMRRTPMSLTNGMGICDLKVATEEKSTRKNVRNVTIKFVKVVSHYKQQCEKV